MNDSNRAADDAAELSIDEFENGLKNHYYLSKRMTPAAFEKEQTYHVRRRRLLNRAIHGWGVVHGFGISQDANAAGRLCVGAGLALDDAGRELVQVEAHPLAVSDIWTNEQIKNYKDNPNQPWILSVHYAERHEQPIPVSAPCQCDRMEWEYTRETVCYSLKPKHSIPEPEKYPSCDVSGRPGVAGDRGPHERLCGMLTGRGAPPSDAGLALATVYLAVGEDACKCRTVLFKELKKDTCSLRRLVIGNEMLYDLIRGRDLTRIEQVSWMNLPTHEADPETGERHVEWKSFKTLFSSAKNQQQHGTLTTGLSVKFSAPVQKSTLTSHSFAMSVTTRESTGGWGQTQRVPLRTPSYTEGACTAYFTVAARWFNGEFPEEQDSRFDDVTLVEIEVRGDLILDCCGQPIDANSIGPNPPPSGNGSPGGTFLSCFRLAKRSVDDATATPASPNV